MENILQSNKENLIKSLKEYYSCNPKNFTTFRKDIELILKENIKPLIKSSPKNLGNDWRSKLKERFHGRGCKWHFVSLEEVEETLLSFENKNIDCSNYRKHTLEQGKAWIRYSGPRILNGIPHVAFELRTIKSTVDQPHQLHYIELDKLDDIVTLMPGTPKSLKLEESSKPIPNQNKIKPKKKKLPKNEIFIKVNSQQKYNEINDIEEKEIILNETPKSSDPDDWEAFLKGEGLIFENDLEFDI